jgi:phosphatidylserine decarboxylase
MRIAPEARRVAPYPALAAAIAWIVGGPYWGVPLAALAVGAVAFFRDPERRLPDDPAALVAPADGRVVAVETGRAHPLAPEATTRVSIFMSPADVHVNRSPVTGDVCDVVYKKGAFGAAFEADASETNEANAMLLRAAGGYDVVVVQIAGWLARRIICRVAAGARLTRGERFGLIMFGSRVDIFLPPHVDVAVAVGQRTTAGVTVLARERAEEDGHATT